MVLICPCTVPRMAKEMYLAGLVTLSPNLLTILCHTPRSDIDFQTSLEFSFSHIEYHTTPLSCSPRQLHLLPSSVRSSDLTVLSLVSQGQDFSENRTYSFKTGFFLLSLKS